MECGIPARHSGSLGAMQGRVESIVFWKDQPSAGFSKHFNFFLLLCITSPCGLLSGVAAGSILGPGVLVGCLQEAEMINKPISIIISLGSQQESLLRHTQFFAFLLISIQLL